MSRRVLVDIELVRSLKWSKECGQILRAARFAVVVPGMDKPGISQQQLVDRLKGQGVTAYTSTIQNLESQANPSAWVHTKTLRALCTGIGCKISDIIPCVELAAN